LSQHAEVLLRSGDLAGAEFTLGEAFAFVERSKERHWLSDLHCLAAKLALARQKPDVERARASFHEALCVAHGQKCLMSELRAATQLARLDAVSDRGRDIPVTMKAILTSISGGSDTCDVEEARIFLEDKKKIDPGP
jgi:predicted ATPase